MKKNFIMLTCLALTFQIPISCNRDSVDQVLTKNETSGEDLFKSIMFGAG